MDILQQCIIFIYAAFYRNNEFICLNNYFTDFIYSNVANNADECYNFQDI